eukprot:2933228-Prymnesium_polylepis.1
MREPEMCRRWAEQTISPQEICGPAAESDRRNSGAHGHAHSPPPNGTQGHHTRGAWDTRNDESHARGHRTAEHAMRCTLGTSMCSPHRAHTQLARENPRMRPQPGL